MSGTGTPKLVLCIRQMYQSGSITLINRRTVLDLNLSQNSFEGKMFTSINQTFSNSSYFTGTSILFMGVLVEIESLR